MTVTCLLLSLPFPLLADTVRLRDGSVVQGTLQTYADSSAQISLKDGSTRTLRREEIERIDVGDAPQPSGENFLSAMAKPPEPYGSPAITFEAWKKAAVAGDLKAMADCYASFKRKEILKQLKELPKDGREKMQATTAQTEFIPSEPLYQGDRAFLEVRWSSGMSGDSQSLQFILEKTQWKILQ